MRSRILPLICLLLLVNLSSSETIKVEKLGETLEINAEKIQDVWHISATDLAKIFNSQVFFDPIS